LKIFEKTISEPSKYLKRPCGTLKIFKKTISEPSKYLKHSRHVKQPFEASQIFETTI
jgi:hypothetical protein